MKVFIVDDSVVFRMSISEALKGVDGIDIVGTASNGQVALDTFQRNGFPDLVILDMEMPVMDGITAIKQIRKLNKKMIIIVFSSLTLKGAELTLSALSEGANDFVTKQETSSVISMADSLKMIQSILIPKILAFDQAFRSAKNKNDESTQPVESHKALDKTKDYGQPAFTVKNVENEITRSPSLLIIASSTGGPEALSTIVKGIKVKPQIPILIVQHMPPIFTEKLAQMLNKQTDLFEIKEAKNGEKVVKGFCYIAPGDFHMSLTSDFCIELTQTDKVSYVRPSATVLFDSIGRNFQGKTISFVLTGMGDDGAAGLKKLVERGDYLYIQDEKSSVVWGMPSAVKNIFPKIKELPLLEIAPFLNKIFEQSRG